jgi:hypothetical protein
MSFARRPPDCYSLCLDVTRCQYMGWEPEHGIAAHNYYVHKYCHFSLARHFLSGSVNRLQLVAATRLTVRPKDSSVVSNRSPSKTHGRALYSCSRRFPGIQVIPTPFPTLSVTVSREVPRSHHFTELRSLNANPCANASAVICTRATRIDIKDG